MTAPMDTREGLLDPLQMLLDAAFFIERAKPDWAKSARAAVARARGGLAPAPRKDWLDLANYLERATDCYLKSIETPFAEAHKNALQSVLWDDKSTFIEALRAGSTVSSPHQSAPPILAPHTSGERVPSSDAALGGAGTALSRPHRGGVDG